MTVKSDFYPYLCSMGENREACYNESIDNKIFVRLGRSFWNHLFTSALP